jgi:hypothetical protein
MLSALPAAHRAGRLILAESADASAPVRLTGYSKSSSAYLVHLVCSVYLVCLVNLVEPDQLDEPDKPNRPDGPDRRFGLQAHIHRDGLVFDVTHIE